MLIEFSVSNFRSFRERQTFSMVAAPRLAHRGNVVKPDIKGEADFPNLLKIAAIYGPNASGKSNLLKAFGVLHLMMAREPGSTKPLPVFPFRFDPQLRELPSSFDVHFVTNRKRYQFELLVTAERIIEERLTVYVSGEPELLYERRHVDNESDRYRFGGLEGGAELLNAWRKLTGPRSLFIAQAVANSDESLQQLRDPHLWLAYQMMVVGDKMTGMTDSVKSLLKDNSRDTSAGISKFMQELDVPITKIRVSDGHADASNSTLLTSKLDENVTTLTHTTALGSAEFDFSEESDGTQGLFGFWLPWTVFSFEKGKLSSFIVDELDSSLHPEIVAVLIEKFLKNERPTQLIFTTHDTHLMKTKLLRRDQFWMTERDENGATKLRSVYDFDGREGEDLEGRYYQGRYRGLPHLRRV